MWILTAQNSAVPLTWNVASSEKHTWRRKSGDASVLSSVSTAKFLRVVWSLGFSAWIIWIFYALRRSILCSTSYTVERWICNCKLAARIDFLGLRWNAPRCNAFDIFFRGPCLSRRFYTQQTTCCPQIFVPEPNVLPCMRLTSLHIAS
jgi:hypothetical protein